VCEVGFYAIPYQNQTLLTELDPDGWEDQVAASTSNAILDFWCVPCPNGADCSLEGTVLANVTALEGYFMGLGAVGTHFYTCLNAACLVGGECAAGYEGDFCTECSEGLIQTTDFECSECVDPGVTVTIFVLGIVAVVGLLVYKVHAARTEETGLPSLMSTWFKIVMSGLQANSVAVLVFPWTDQMLSVLGFQQDVSSLGVSYVELECLSPGMSSPYLTTTIMFALAPVMFELLAAVGTLLYVRCAEADHMKPLQLTLSLSKCSLVIILFLFQPTLTQRAAQLLSCVQLGPAENDWFLAGDLSVRCWVSSQHNMILWTLGLFMFAAYVFGIPFAGFYILRTNKAKVLRTIRNTLAKEAQSKAERGTDDVRTLQESEAPPSLTDEEQEFRVNFSFLFLGYKTKSFYWEIVVMLRKALLVIIAVVFKFDPRLQGLLSMVLVYFALVAQVRRLPYTSHHMNLLEFASLFVTSSTFVLGQLCFDAGGVSYAEEASTLALTLNVLFLFLVLGSFIHIQKANQCAEVRGVYSGTSQWFRNLSKTIPETIEMMDTNGEQDALTMGPVSPEVTADSTVFNLSQDAMPTPSDVKVSLDAEKSPSSQQNTSGCADKTPDTSKPAVLMPQVDPAPSPEDTAKQASLQTPSVQLQQELSFVESADAEVDVDVTLVTKPPDLFALLESIQPSLQEPEPQESPATTREVAEDSFYTTGTSDVKALPSPVQSTLHTDEEPESVRVAKSADTSLDKTTQDTTRRKRSQKKGSKQNASRRVYARALHAFTASDKGKLSFGKGDTLCLYENFGEKNWLKAVLVKSSSLPVGGKGYIPRNYVKRIQ
jgi:hypothetical protein